jgi:hypothetical protein
MRLPFDEGMDIVAEKHGKSLKIQVKTKNKDSRGRFIIFIGVDAFERFREEKNIFFAFLLTEGRSGITRIVIMSGTSVQKLIRDGLNATVGKDKDFYRLEFRIGNDGVFLRQLNVSCSVDNWDSIR